VTIPLAAAGYDAIGVDIVASEVELLGRDGAEPYTLGSPRLIAVAR
jgi:hypothetical protein